MQLLNSFLLLQSFLALALPVGAQENKAIMQKQCEKGDIAVCKSLAVSACDGLTTADQTKVHAMCTRTARCYMKLAGLPKESFPLKSGVAQRCEEHYQGSLTTLAPSAISVSWIPTTSSTVEQLSPLFKSGLIGSALAPAAQVDSGAEPGNIPEYPYDFDNHVFMNVCQAHLRSPSSGHVATVPGKFLNNNCNVVFEGEFLVAHQFELAVITSQEHGYWMPVPPDGNLQNALTSTPGPDGKAYTLCTAKTFTDTSYVKNALDAGVRWHGHHIGNLNAKKECVTEWGGSPAVSGVDVRVYFVGAPPTFAAPTSVAWYVDSIGPQGDSSASAHSPR